MKSFFQVNTCLIYSVIRQVIEEDFFLQIFWESKDKIIIRINISENRNGLDCIHKINWLLPKEWKNVWSYKHTKKLFEDCTVSFLGAYTSGSKFPFFKEGDMTMQGFAPEMKSCVFGWTSDLISGEQKKSIRVSRKFLIFNVFMM